MRSPSPRRVWRASSGRSERLDTASSRMGRTLVHQPVHQRDLVAILRLCKRSPFYESLGESYSEESGQMIVASAGEAYRLSFARLSEGAHGLGRRNDRQGLDHPHYLGTRDAIVAVSAPRLDFDQPTFHQL
jgi:hypothetical protein